MRKFILFFSVLSAITSCSQKPQQAESVKMTLKDSLLEVLKETYGDIIFYNEFANGVKLYEYRLNDSLHINLPTATNVKNSFDKIIRKERTKTKEVDVHFDDVKNTYITATSDYEWESFDYVITLHYSFYRRNSKDTTEVIENDKYVFFTFQEK